jgi:hypothetical protein
VFSKEPNVGFVIIKIIGFASTIIVGVLTLILLKLETW